jgi:NADH-quinone oxidoreductase subunit N
MIGILIVFIGAVLVLFLGLNKPEGGMKTLSSLVLFLAGVLSLLESLSILNFERLSNWAPKNMIDFSKGDLMFVSLLAFVTAAIIAIFPTVEEKGSDRLGLMMLSLTGAFMMIGADHLVMLFLGIEVLSIPLYVLAGSDKHNLRSNEAAIKYFLMGAFSTAIFLLGCAFIYGGSGSLSLSEISLRMSIVGHLSEFPALIKVGVILMSTGLLFKVSAFPFHFWAPDVYEGSPNKVTTFMAVVVKIAGFVAFANYLQAFEALASWYSKWLIILAVCTIIFGNIAAISQKTVKRTLAYSSIAHAGYLLLFLITPMKANMWILFAYSVAYALSTVVLFYFNDKYSTKKEYGFGMFSGLLKNNQSATILMVISLFSIAGIPVTVGFTAKYYLFTSAFEVSPLAVGIALLGSAISIMYYFKAFKPMFESAESNTNEAHASKIHFVVYLMVAASIVFGMFPYLFERCF